MADSIHQQICEALVAKYKALGLTGIGTSVVGGTFADALKQNLEYPCLLVLKVGSKTLVGGTNARDDWGYPIVLMVLDRQAPEDQADEDLWSYWQERLLKTTVNQRTAGMPDVVYKAEFNSNLLVDANAMKALEFQRIVGSIVLSFISRESRG